MSICDAIQQRLSEDGSGIVDTDAEVRRHVGDCAACTRILAELRRLEAMLAALPEHDAPEALVAETLDAVRRAPGAEPARPRLARAYLAGGLAASIVAVAALGVTFSVFNQSFRGDAPSETSSTSASPLGEYDLLSELPARDEVAQQAAEGEPRDLAAQMPAAPEAMLRETFGAFRGRDDDLAGGGGDRFFDLSDRRAGDQREWEVIARLDAPAVAGERAGFVADNKRDVVEGQALRQLDEGALVGGDVARSMAKSVEAPRPNAEHAPEEAGASTPAGPTSRTESNRPDEQAAATVGRSAKPSLDRNEAVGNLEQRRVVTGDPSRRGARDFLDAWRALDGLAFQAPRGYWANSYIPGDPEMRLLEARLRDWNRDALGPRVELEQAVRPVRQPFDAPRDAAMAVYLDADAAAVAGPTRLRLQVGLKGAERQGGHRPAMNIGLVVDLRDTADAAAGARIRALIDALEQARQPEDRFALTLAGPGGGLLVPAARFRHGPLQVAMNGMFDPSARSASPNVGLADAVALAEAAVREGDDPGGVLGSSLVLLVTGSNLAGDIATLEPIAHRNAIGGIALSVVSLGGQDDLAQVDRLVAAGQGHRRVLDSAQAAAALVDRELHAASRSVARALRLRIRLADGVKLIDVLGSRPLGAPQAEQVREAEQAIDRRLARNLGIEADRGDDEEGIQIVIPSFYAGDTHVILLDVVAERPGPIADVTVRYKDVVYLRNGTARASLAIEDGDDAPGPLQRNVLKNLVAWEFAGETREVGRALARGEVPAAAARLESLRALVAGLRREVTGWSSDADLAADEALLGQYLAALRSPVAGDARQQRWLADSLHYAAFRKLQPAAR